MWVTVFHKNGALITMLYTLSSMNTSLVREKNGSIKARRLMHHCKLNADRFFFHSAPQETVIASASPKHPADVTKSYP